MEVTLYTTPTCTFCHTMKGALNKRGVDYKEVNLFEDREAQKYFSSVPTLVVEEDGTRTGTMVGWTNIGVLDTFLKDHGVSTNNSPDN